MTQSQSEAQSDTKLVEYIVFLGRDADGQVVPARITCRSSKLKTQKGEFAAFVVEAKDKPQAVWKAAQMYYSTIAIALSELWAMDAVANAQDWDWDKFGHDSILSGVELAKEEFAEHLDLSPDEIILPQKRQKAES